jgi:hypothetical protein
LFLLLKKIAALKKQNPASHLTPEGRSFLGGEKDNSGKCIFYQYPKNGTYGFCGFE